MNIIIAIIMLLSSVGAWSTIEDGWLGIKPLEVNKTKVEELLGKPETIDDSGYYNYRTNSAFVQINYTEARCESLKTFANRGKYDVENFTVLDYSVHIKKPIELCELSFNREAYIKETDIHLPDNFYYVSKKDGIRISIRTEVEKMFVWRIDFRPNEQNEEKFKCKK